jgi:hypothetical protein
MNLSPDRRLVQLIRALGKVESQNRLMTASDREIALSMMYLKDHEREEILSLLPQKKSARIREELTLHNRLRIRYDQYRKTIEHLLEILAKSGKRESFKSYLRPFR